MLERCKTLPLVTVNSYNPLHPLNKETPPTKADKMLVVSPVESPTLLLPLFTSLLIFPLGEVSPIPDHSAGIHSLFPNFLQLEIPISSCNTYIYLSERMPLTLLEILYIQPLQSIHIHSNRLPSLLLAGVHILISSVHLILLFFPHRVF